jgi:membrane protein
MAKLHHVPIVIRSMGFVRFCHSVWSQVQEDQVFTWAAALAYSWMFAIFPFLLFLLTLFPLLPSRAKHELYRDIEKVVDNTLPKEAAEPIKQQATDLLDHPRTGLMSAGILITLWAAAGGTSMTMSALDRCYDIHPHKARSYIRQRAIALLLTLAVVILILIVVLLLPVTTGFLYWLAYKGIVLGWLRWAINIARITAAGILLFASLGLIYHFGPALKRQFDPLSPGAIFCLIMWAIMGGLFRAYIDLFGAASYNKTYGAVGGVVILLFLFYIDAIMMLIGAEINSEIDFALVGLPSDLKKGAVQEPLVDDEAHRALREELLHRRAAHPPAA